MDKQIAKQVAQALHRAMSLFEAHQPVDGYDMHRRSQLRQCCKEACEGNSVPLFEELVYLALEAWWNDASDWATEVLLETTDMRKE